MKQRILLLPLIFVFLYLCMFEKAQCQKKGNPQANAKQRIGSFYWDTLNSQKSKKICRDTEATIFIYSEASNFVLMSDNGLLSPTYTISYAKNINKHVFCLKQDSTLNLSSPQYHSDGLIDVASFIMSKNSEKLPEMTKSVEEIAEKQKQLLEQEEELKREKLSKQAIRMDSVVKFSLQSKKLESTILFWEKLDFQKTIKKDCPTANNTTVFVYTKIPNFIMNDGENIKYPISTTTFLNDIQKNIFCLEHPGKDFIVPFSQNSDSIIDVACFVVGEDVEELSEMSVLVKQTIEENEKHLASVSIKEIEKANTSQQQVSVELFWQKLTPQKAEKEECDGAKTMIFVYSEIPDFSIFDGKNVVYPLSIKPFVGNIKKNVFCTESLIPDYVVSSSANSEQEKSVVSFVADKNVERLPELANLIEQTIKDRQQNSAQKNTIENSISSLKKDAPVSISILLKEIATQKLDAEFCDSTKTTILVYTKILDLTLPNGENVAHPTTTTSLEENVLKNIFCIESSSFLAFNKRNDGVNVSTFIAGKDSLEIAEVQKIAEKKDILAEEQKPKEDVSESKQVIASPFWQELNPQKVDKQICDKATMIFVYSDIPDFTLLDGDTKIHPISTIPFLKNIDKKIFCIKSPNPKFSNPSFAKDSSILSFVVSKNEAQLSEMTRLIENKISQQQLLIENQGKEQQVKRNVSDSKNDKKNEITVHKSTPKISDSLSEAISKNKITSNYKYRIQLLEKEKTSIDRKDLKKFSHLPYTLLRDKKKDVEYLIIGSYSSLDEAKIERKKIMDKYKISGLEIILYEGTKRICSF